MSKIYVGNLPFTADEAAVRALFEQHGTVESVSLINDRETGPPVLGDDVQNQFSTSGLRCSRPYLSGRPRVREMCSAPVRPECCEPEPCALVGCCLLRKFAGNAALVAASTRSDSDPAGRSDGPDGAGC